MFRVNESTAEIFIYDEIGPAWAGMIDATMVLDALERFSGRETVIRLNTPGGDVFEAIAILNAMKRHGMVDVAIDSLAASAGASIAMGGRKVTIAKNAQMMVHHPWTIAIGDASDFRKLADDLDRITDSLVSDMVEKTGQGADFILSLLDETTYMNAEQAVELGFADEIGLAVVSDDAVAKAHAASLEKVNAKRTDQTEATEAFIESPAIVAARFRARKKIA